MTSIPKITIKNGRDGRILNGHLWVFSNEIEPTENSIPPGSLVDIVSNKKKFLGRGFYNPRSLIAARILSYKDESIDKDFFARRIAAAAQTRTALIPEETSYRLVFGESDWMPGLVIDRYENVFVFQSYCLGMDLLMPLVIEGLKNNFTAVEGLVKKNDSAIREMEGLGQEVSLLSGSPKFPMAISQKLGSQTIRFSVDPMEGQKTGFYFDQRENRKQLARYCKDKSVLDCFSYSGGFALYAAQGRAKEVTAIESGENACQLLKQNCLTNGVDLSVMQGDVFELLDRFKTENRKFDIIVLDPPALAKSKKHLFGALRKYKKLNEQAFSLLNSGGILFSCSCSHHVIRSDFLEMISQAGAAQNRQTQLLEMRGQSLDHPILPSMPETDYLKCAVLRVN